MNFSRVIVLLLILLIGVGYVSWHVWQLLPMTVTGKWVVTSALLLCLVCFLPILFLVLMISQCQWL